MIVFKPAMTGLKAEVLEVVSVVVTRCWLVAQSRCSWVLLFDFRVRRLDTVIVVFQVIIIWI